MAVFRFSLEQVLVYRTQLEDKAKSEFGKAQSAVNQEKYRQNELRENLYAHENKLTNLPVSELGERWLIENFMKALRADIEQSKKNLINLEKKAEVARSQLALAAKDRMIMDKLKEKHEKAFKFEELQKEQREFDEIASIRFKAPTY